MSAAFIFILGKPTSETEETAAELFPNDIDKYMEYKSPIIKELYIECGAETTANTK